MDVARLIEQFATIHGRRPESKHELESWFAKYASSPVVYTHTPKQSGTW
jgi:hypothetical protein